MQRQLTLLLLVLLTAATALADDAEALLSRAEGALKRQGAVTARFTLDTGGNAYSGTISAAGDRFAIDTPAYKTWYDGTQQWTWADQAGEVTLTIPTADELAMLNPFAVIGAFRKAYTARMLKGASGEQVVELTARRRDADLRRVVVTLSAATLLPRRLLLYPASGETVTVTVNDIQRLNSVNDAMFRYNPASYPDCPIIDLR